MVRESETEEKRRKERLEKLQTALRMVAGGLLEKPPQRERVHAKTRSARRRH